MKSQLNFQSVLRVTEISFFTTNYGISLHWDYKPHVVYIGQIKENTNTVGKIHSNCVWKG